jgi:hypothetical protein
VKRHPHFSFSFFFLVCIAYTKFALQVQGHVYIVVEPMADVQFLQRSVVSNFQTDAISSVTIYGDDNCESSKGIEMLTSSIKEKGIGEVVCKSSVVEFYLDSRDMKGSGDEEQDEPDKGVVFDDDGDDKNGEFPRDDTDSNQNGEPQHKEEKPCHGRTVFLIILSVLAYCLCYYGLRDGSCFDTTSKSSSPIHVVGNYCKNLLYSLQKIWRGARDYLCIVGLSLFEAFQGTWCHVRDYVLGKTHSHEEENTSENSPLMNRGSYDVVIDEFAGTVQTKKVQAQ